MNTLTAEQINAMPAGREMDALLIVAFLNWAWQPYQLHNGAIKLLLWTNNPLPKGNDFDYLAGDPNRLIPWDIPSCSTNISDAWKVVEKLRAMGFRFEMRDPPFGYWVMFGEEMTATAETAPLAIGRAALKAYRSSAPDSHPTL